MISDSESNHSDEGAIRDTQTGQAASTELSKISELQHAGQVDAQQERTEDLPWGLTLPRDDPGAPASEEKDEQWDDALPPADGKRVELEKGKYLQYVDTSEITPAEIRDRGCVKYEPQPTLVLRGNLASYHICAIKKSSKVVQEQKQKTVGVIKAGRVHKHYKELEKAFKNTPAYAKVLHANDAWILMHEPKV
ncbi:hypothetical protein LTR66_016638 [Elasticomyces elasticus]|nr:hypothetical protein LTR66_016638 [Elasticomyces elasticus]